MSLVARRRIQCVIFVLVCCVLIQEATSQDLSYMDEYEFAQASKNMIPRSITKRSTVLLNRLMYALHSAFQPDAYPPSVQQMELQRRGYPKHYWKCYFNAVSCFRRKR